MLDIALWISIALFAASLMLNVFRLAIGPDLPDLVSTDPGRLRQVLLNLVSNAVDACAEKGGTVTVSARREAPDAPLVLRISDTGSGIPEKDLRRLFQAFFSTKGSRGTGLGLAIVKHILLRHGADLDVESRMGHGTTFTIAMPAAGELTAAAEYAVCFQRLELSQKCHVSVT